MRGGAGMPCGMEKPWSIGMWAMMAADLVEGLLLSRIDEIQQLKSEKQSISCRAVSRTGCSL